VPAGADIIELGVPLFRPLADGPVIQAAAVVLPGLRRAVDDVLSSMGASVRSASPIILFTCTTRS